jgi:cis-L-3-hydroxyproline dehydratase
MHPSNAPMQSTWEKLVLILNCLDGFRSFAGAAFGTTAASPLIHIAGVTPEATDPLDVADMISICSKRQEKVTLEALDETFRLLDQQNGPRGPENKDSHISIDWIALGNPHLSLSECDELLRLVESDVPAGRRKHEDVPVMAW